MTTLFTPNEPHIKLDHASTILSNPRSSSPLPSNSLHHVTITFSRVYYGDAKEPGVIKSLGLENPAVVAVCYSGRLRSIGTVRAVRSQFPNVRILARATNVAHAADLRAAGADETMTMTTDTGIEIGRRVVGHIGMDESEANFLVNSMRKAIEMSERRGDMGGVGAVTGATTVARTVDVANELGSDSPVVELKELTTATLLPNLRQRLQNTAKAVVKNAGDVGREAVREVSRSGGSESQANARGEGDNTFASKVANRADPQDKTDYELVVMAKASVEKNFEDMLRSASADRAQTEIAPAPEAKKKASTADMFEDMLRESAAKPTTTTTMTATEAVMSESVDVTPQQNCSVSGGDAFEDMLRSAAKKVQDERRLGQGQDPGVST